MRAVVVSPNASKYADLIDNFRKMKDYVSREKIEVCMKDDKS